jgi:hypothetical protein
MIVGEDTMMPGYKTGREGTLSPTRSIVFIDINGIEWEDSKSNTCCTIITVTALQTRNEKVGKFPLRCGVYKNFFYTGIRMRKTNSI